MHIVSPSLTSSTSMSEKFAQFFKGENILQLLELPVNARILILGKALEAWAKYFRQSFFYPDINAIPAGQNDYALILYHSECAVSGRKLIKHLSMLGKIAGENGILMIFAGNFYSPANLKKLIKDFSGENFNKPRLGYRGFCRAMMRAGLKDWQAFIPMPKLIRPGEMVKIGSQLLELPFNKHSLTRLSRNCDLFNVITEGYIFFSPAEKLENGQLLKKCTMHFSEPHSDFPRLLNLERIDIRDRGAMILFLSGQKSKHRIIARVVSDSRTREIVSRNKKFLNFLHGLKSLPPNLKKLLPLPLGDFESNGSSVFMEQMLPGILSWKVNKGKLRNRIYLESVNFLLDLNRASRVKVEMTDALIDHLLLDDLERIEACPGIIPLIKNELFKNFKKLRKDMLGRQAVLAFSHGDYGYGNILVDSINGRITGVIDWDAGRHLEFAGVDFINLEIQRNRIEEKNGFYEAFSAVAKRVLNLDSQSTLSGYRNEFGLEGDLSRIQLSVAFLRYIARSANYPEMFVAAQKDYLKSLSLLQDLLKAPKELKQ